MSSSTIDPPELPGGRTSAPTLRSVEISVYSIPTQTPESDGTLEWDHTTLILVQVHAGNEIGLGYTYADQATAHLIQEHLVKRVVGRDPMAVTAIWQDLVRAIRNLGRPGIASMAISAMDTALWDLKAK